MLNVAEQTFEVIQGHLDQCVRFRTEEPMTNTEIAEALGVCHDPSGRKASASLFFQDTDGIKVVGVKIGDHEFGIKPQFSTIVERAEAFATKKNVITAHRAARLCRAVSVLIDTYLRSFQKDSNNRP